MSDTVDSTQPTYPNDQKVFVGNIPFNCTTEQFQNCFNQLEGYVTADVIRRFNSHLSRGFGFVVFSTPEQAQALLNSSNPVELDDRPFRYSEYRDNSDRSRVFKIFVDNLESGTTDEDLKDAFVSENEGNVLSTFVNCNGNKTTGVVMVDTHELFKGFLDNPPLLDGVPLNVKPFRRQNRSKDPRTIHKNGYQAGYVVGFQAGLQKGLAGGGDLVAPKLTRSRAGGTPPANR